MTDTQHLITTARAQLDSISTDIERHFDALASHLRHWLPSSDRTSPTLSIAPARPIPPPTLLRRLERWANAHKALTAAAAAFLLSGSVAAALYAQQNKLSRRKRRARKSPSGARTDVVVVACGTGGVANPLAAALYLDLERRGFVVYVVATTGEEENYIRAQGRADLMPLHLDLGGEGTAAEGQMRRFHSLLAREHLAFEGAEGHRLRFRGVVLVPDLNGPSSSTGEERIEDLTPRDWSTALHAHLHSTIATTKLFLPSITTHAGTICLLTPSVPASLRLPGHGLESTIASALEAYITTLRAEMRDAHPNVGVHHFQLGDIEIPAVTARQRRDGLVGAGKGRGTSQRVLCNAVFDALSAEGRAGGGGTWWVGCGSWVYGFVGRWAPGGLVGWMVGSGAGRGRKEGRREEKVLAIEDSMEGSRGSLPGWENVGREG